MLPIINGVGTLTREPEQRFTQGGKSIVSFSLAFNERFKDASGQQKENVTFIDCTVFGALGEKVVMPYVHRGDKLYIVGKLNLDQWTSQDGSKRSKHSVTVESMQMLGSKEDSQAQKEYVSPEAQAKYYENHPSNANQQNQQGTTPTVPEIDIGEDEIPFSGISKKLAMVM